MPTLFDPVRIGAWSLPNRIIFAPLTRARAGAERIPNALMAEYYAQRAAVGLIISEATSVTPMGVGYANTPGIWSAAQVDGWRLVTDAVHKAGGRMVLQLWHVGRISDPQFLNGALPVAPSAIAAAGHVSLVRPLKPFVTPRALGLEEIPGIIEGYRVGAENAKKAGFDGVEIHGANGYLLDHADGWAGYRLYNQFRRLWLYDCARSNAECAALSRHSRNGCCNHFRRCRCCHQHCQPRIGLYHSSQRVI